MMMRCCSLSVSCTTRLAYLAKLWLKDNSNKLTRIAYNNKPSATVQCLLRMHQPVDYIMKYCSKH